MTIKKILVAGAIAIAGAGGFAISGCDTSTPPATEQQAPEQGVGSKDASADVQAGGMVVEYGAAHIPVTVTNSTDEDSDYYIEATLYDASGVQVDTAIMYVQRVAPGGKANGELLGVNGSSAESYKVTLVERTASV